jgi:hypothetical protein
MRLYRALQPLAIIVVVGLLAAPTSSALSELRCGLREPVDCLTEEAATPLEGDASYGRHSSHARYATKVLSAATASAKLYPAEIKRAEDAFWEARYAIYQGLISQGSAPLLNSDLGYLESSDGTPICLLHGRSDVLQNATLIRYIGALHPETPPIIVAAAIAEQASDVERVFGVDILEEAALTVLPGKEDMSIGIAQLRPTEMISLGLGGVDLFDPEMAVRGMYAKLALAGELMDDLASADAPLSPTERYMLLSLAQNHLGTVNDYYAVDGDWDQLMAMGNYARIMRYFLVHLDWLHESGWELPPDVDLDRWRRVVFSTPQEADPPELGRRS